MRDIEFMLYEWLNVEELTRWPSYADHSRDGFDAFLHVAGQIAERDFADHNARADREPPRIEDGRVRMLPEVESALRAFAEAGLASATMDHGLGGVRMPQVIHRACFAWMQAANISTAGYALLSMAAANLILAHGSADQIDTYARPLAEGRFFGTMCLSEPQAGSSLGDISTLATRDADGGYRIRGTKMWISAGDHEMGENIVHLVLARTPGAPPGAKGLSLFIVPKYLVTGNGERGQRNDVVLAGLNHKMGNRGTVNAVLAFGDAVHEPLGSGGAIGYLVGEENSGLGYMFHMMNEARIGVGAGATALGYTAYLHALDYAEGRAQGRLTGAKDARLAQVPIIRHPDVRRMLMASKAYVEGALGLVLLAARLSDESVAAPDEARRAAASRLLDVLTPVVKSWPAQWCLAANDLAIQVHGGYGYTIDYPVEQFYRDNRLNAIHEGTNGIQALDLLGRKVVEDEGAGLACLVAAIRATTSSAAGGRFADWARRLDDAIGRVETVTRKLWQDGDAARALAAASIYLEAFGHVVIAWIWLQQALAAGTTAGPFYDGKRAAARYFFSCELPRVTTQLDSLGDAGDMFLSLDHDIL
jgi:alkylation response protein AidB-like acyl-CoA dehydrogenase